MGDGDEGGGRGHGAAGGSGAGRPAPPANPLRDGGKSQVLDALSVLAAPTEFWKRAPETRPAGRRVWLHLLVLIGLRSVAGCGGALLRGVGFGASLGQLFSGLISSFVMVWLFAAIVASVVATAGSKGRVRDAFHYAAYGLTPLFAIGILAVVPLPYVSPIADLVLMPYTFYVLAVGVIPALGVAAERAPGRAGIICGALLLLWSLMPTLIPLAVGALVH